MTFDLISGLHMQIQTWHPPLWLCTHAKYYVESGLTNVLKNANKTKNMPLFSIRIANYYKAVTLTAVHLKLKVKGQCLTLKCRNQSECQTGWEKENLKSHHLRAFIKVSAKLISCIP